MENIKRVKMMIGTEEHTHLVGRGKKIKNTKYKDSPLCTQNQFGLSLG